MVWFSWDGLGWLVGCCVSPCLPPRTDPHITTSTHQTPTGGGLGGARAGHRGEPGRRRHRHLGAWRGRRRGGNAMHVCCREWWMWLLHIYTHTHTHTSKRTDDDPPTLSPTNQSTTHTHNQPHTQPTTQQRFFPDEAREKYIAPTLRALFLTPHQVYREGDKRRKEGGGRRLLFMFWGAVVSGCSARRGLSRHSFIHSPCRSPPPLQHQPTLGRRPRGGRRRGGALRRRHGPR